LTVRDVFDGDSFVREQIRLRAEITKGGHARVVFVNDKLRKEIERYFGGWQIERLPDAPLLLTQRNTAFSANTLCQLLGQLYKQAGLDGATSHSGRRWFITRLAHSGVSPKVIMTLAGHRNLTTTQRYIDVRVEMMK
ncbi:site-specific integrase, partial [Bacillus subtilis]